jgi:hypothetical protein
MHGSKQESVQALIRASPMTMARGKRSFAEKA